MPSAGFGVVVLLAWLAFGRYGKVKLGLAEDEIEYSDFSWNGHAVLCRGGGRAAVLGRDRVDALLRCTALWCDAAITRSSGLGLDLRHFSLGDYRLVFLLSADAGHRLSRTTPNVSHICASAPAATISSAARKRHRTGRRRRQPGRQPRDGVIDLFFMIALLGGAGSSLGFSTPMIAACIARLTGLEVTFGLEVFSVLLCVALFAASVWFGLNRGIKRLSDLNLVLAFVLLLFLLALRANPVPARDFAEQPRRDGAEFSEDELVDRTPLPTRSSFGTGRCSTGAWWIAYAPFVGLFVTRISRARTITPGDPRYDTLWLTGRRPFLYDLRQFRLVSRTE